VWSYFTRVKATDGNYKKCDFEVIKQPTGGQIVHITDDGNHTCSEIVEHIKGYACIGGATLTGHEPVVLTNSFLASMVSNPRGGYLGDTNVFRRYTSNVRTIATVGGVDDIRHVQVNYEVGRRFKSVLEALAPARQAARIDAAYPTGSALAEDFVGLAKKYTNFSATFEFSSLGGVVERLARGLAASSLSPGVTSTALRGNEALCVQALGTHDGPVNSLTTTVFVPRLVNSNITGDVFSVLVNAIAGEGGAISTDVLELDAVTRQPIIPEVGDADIARAIVDALRVLGSNMIASGQGPLFSLAITRGLHRTVSVVGHTDEGAFSRDLMRAGHFGVPFGGIHYGLAPYSGLPALSSDDPTSIATYVDSLALATAALVAHCDPGERYGGRWFPTFYLGTATDAETGMSGSHTPGTPDMAKRNFSQILGGLSRFTDLYVSGLARLFAAEGDTRVASVFMGTTALYIPSDNRHLRFASIAPWFWIEPTSLLPSQFLGSPAEVEGFASFGGRDSTHTRAAWEDIAQVGPGDVAYGGYCVVMRSARTSWFLHHWLENPRNGLGAISVRQLDPNVIVHPGSCQAAENVAQRVAEGRPLSDFLWKRGQTPFAAPSEFMNLGGIMGIFVRHLTLDDRCIPTVEHVPMSHEFLGCTITMHVGRPTGRPSGASNSPAHDVRRAKTQAARELAAASARLAAYGRTDVGEMPILTSTPVWPGRGSRVAPEPTPDLSSGGTTGVVQGDIGGAGGVADAEKKRTGLAVNPVPQHMPIRHPTLTRVGGGVMSGLGAPPTVLPAVVVPDNSDGPPAITAPTPTPGIVTSAALGHGPDQS